MAVGEEGGEGGRVDLGADGDDAALGLGSSVEGGEFGSATDSLEGVGAGRRVGEVDDAFAAVDVGGEVAADHLHEGLAVEGAVGFVAPGLELLAGLVWTGFVPGGEVPGVEAGDGEEDRERDVAAGGFNDADAVEVLAYPFVDDFEVVAGDEVGLVEDDEVGVGDLADFEPVEFVVVGVGEDGLGVDEAGDAVEAKELSVFAVEEGHDDAVGIGDAAGFEDDVVDGVFAGEKALEGEDEVVADLAADAAVAEADGVRFDAVDEVGVDVDGSEVVDEDADAEAVVAVEDAVEESRFSGAEEAGEEGDGDGIASGDDDGLGAGGGGEGVCERFARDG